MDGDTHVRRLIRREFPGLSARAVGRMTGLGEKPYRPFDDAARQGGFPAAQQIRALAEGLSMPILDVLEACVRDAGLEEVLRFDVETRRTARLLAELPPHVRVAFAELVERMLVELIAREQL